jgi:predicted RNA-binding protein with TRAM domain
MLAHKVPGARLPDLGEVDIQEVLSSYAVGRTEEELNS